MMKTIVLTWFSWIYHFSGQNRFDALRATQATETIPGADLEVKCFQRRLNMLVWSILEERTGISGLTCSRGNAITEEVRACKSGRCERALPVVDTSFRCMYEEKTFWTWQEWHCPRSFCRRKISGERIVNQGRKSMIKFRGRYARRRQRRR